VIARFVAVVVALSCIAAPVLAENPKVPPEKDPGAVPVALIGGGVDYTRPDIAKRLARDGEGNIVGWDFVDNDIHPFTRDAQANSEADSVLSLPGVELVPIRVSPTDFEAVAKSAAFLSRTDVRTVVVLPASDKPEHWQLFAKAAAHLKDMLFIVPYRGDATGSYPAALGLPNVLSIALAADAKAVADLALETADGAREPATPIAAASIAAASLATCHADKLGPGDGAARKAAAITALGAPRSASKVPLLQPCR